MLKVDVPLQARSKRYHLSDEYPVHNPCAATNATRRGSAPLKIGKAPPPIKGNKLSLPGRLPRGLFHCGQFLKRCLRVLNCYWQPSTLGVRTSCCPPEVLAVQRVARRCWHAPRRGPASASLWVDNCGSSSSLSPSLVLLPLLFREFALGISGGGKRLFLTWPRGSLTLSHSTPWAAGSSAVSFAHSSALSFPSMPWWLGHHRISILKFGALARRVAICFLAMIAYFWTGPGRLRSSSRRRPGRPWFLVVATRSTLAIAAFVCSYSHATFLDHGGVLVNHFPVCRPLAGSVAAPSPPKPSAFHRGLNPGSRG